MVEDKQYFVYILASRRHGTLYIGITNDLLRRVHEHRAGLLPASRGATARCGLSTTRPTSDAIYREKILKEWRRDWKIALIEQSNPDWADLYEGLTR